MAAGAGDAPKPFPASSSSGRRGSARAARWVEGAPRQGGRSEGLREASPLGRRLRFKGRVGGPGQAWEGLSRYARASLSTRVHRQCGRFTCLPRCRVRWPPQKSPFPLPPKPVEAGRATTPAHNFRLSAGAGGKRRTAQRLAALSSPAWSFLSRPVALPLLWRGQQERPAIWLFSPSPGKRRRSQPARLSLDASGHWETPWLGRRVGCLPEGAANWSCRGARTPLTAPSRTCFLCYYRHPTPSRRACVLETSCTPTRLFLHEWGAFDFLPFAETESGEDRSIA